MICDNCTGAINEAPLIVPRMPSGVSHFHGKGSCLAKANRIARIAWPARIRSRKMGTDWHPSLGPA